MNNPLSCLHLCLCALLLGACSSGETPQEAQTNESVGLAGAATDRNAPLPTNREILELRPQPNPERNAYFGDLHVHTAYSFDAYVFGITNTPDDAYRYAKGEALPYPSGFEMQLRQPLDFYAVTDHAMFLGLVKAAADTSSEFSRYEVARPLHDINAPDNMGPLSLRHRVAAFRAFLPATLAGLLDGSIDSEVTSAVSKSAWRDTIRAAEEANIPRSWLEPAEH